MFIAISLPRSLVERVRVEARRLGMSVEEYLAELLTQGLDPRDRAREYVKAAKDLVAQAREELEGGDVRQAAEKLWGVVALALKAYALWREGRRLVSHRELWEYKDRVVEELGDWVNDAWNAGNAMHTCFYECWCTRKSVEAALKRIEKLVEVITRRIPAEPSSRTQ